MLSYTVSDANRILLSAAENGDLERFDFALEQGADVTLPDDRFTHIEGFHPAHVGVNALHYAIGSKERGELNEERVAIVSKLLTMGVDPNIKGNCADFPLYSAAYSGHQRLVNVLLEHEANMLSKPLDAIQLFQTALYRQMSDLARLQLQHLFASLDEKLSPELYARLLYCDARSGYPDLIQAILAHGTDADEQTLVKIHYRALGAAASQGQHEIVSLFRQYGIDIWDALEDGTPLLHNAAQGGMLELTQELLAGGANANARASLNRTPLHYASRSKNDAIAHILVQNGADLLAYGDDNIHILHNAATTGKNWLVEACLNAGENVDVKNHYGFTPLIDAASNGHIDTMEILLNRGASLNYTIERIGQTALSEALNHRQIAAAHWLIERGAKFHVIDEEQEIISPLLIAATSDQSEVIELLLSHGFDAKHKTEYDETAIHLASQTNALNTIPRLIAAGANVNNRNRKRETPLHAAAAVGNHSVIAILLEAGATINSVNEDDDSPLHYAARFGHAKIVQQLLNAGADRHALNAKGQTALDLAISEGFPHVIKLLQQ